MKKISIVSGFGAFLLLAVLSPAQTATATPTSAGTVLGVLEGTLNFCIKVTPQSASKYKALGQLLINGQSAKAIALVRNSDAYEKSFAQITKQLGALSTTQALAACNTH